MCVLDITCEFPYSKKACVAIKIVSFAELCNEGDAFSG